MNRSLRILLSSNTLGCSAAFFCRYRCARLQCQRLQFWGGCTSLLICLLCRWGFSQIVSRRLRRLLWIDYRPWWRLSGPSQMIQLFFSAGWGYHCHRFTCNPKLPSKTTRDLSHALFFLSLWTVSSRLQFGWRYRHDRCLGWIEFHSLAYVCFWLLNLRWPRWERVRYAGSLWRWVEVGRLQTCWDCWSGCWRGKIYWIGVYVLVFPPVVPVFFDVGGVIGIFHIGLILFLLDGLVEGEICVLVVGVFLEHVAGLLFGFDEFGCVA